MRMKPLSANTWDRIVLLAAPLLILIQWALITPGLPSIINAHESVENVEDLIRLQTVMDQLGISHTVLHAVPYDLLHYDEDNKVDLSQVEANNQVLQEAVDAYPEDFSFFCSMDPKDPNRLALFEDCVEHGARGVKLYNGYSYTHEVTLDAPKLNELYETIAEQEKLLMLPVNAGEYENELRNLLTLHPDLTVICPHFCLSSKNLDRLTALLNEFPNLYIDTSFGFIDYTLEGFQTLSEHHDDFVAFFAEFQDRILFGTDNVITSYEGKTTEWLTALYSDYLSMLSKESFTSALDTNIHYTGLNLPYPILRKVLSQNWMNLIQ